MNHNILLNIINSKLVITPLKTLTIKTHQKYPKKMTLKSTISSHQKVVTMFLNFNSST